MNVYETTVQLDEPRVSLPENFRNKKVRIVVEEVDPRTDQKAKGPLTWATLPLDVDQYPFDRSLLYDENGRI